VKLDGGPDFRDYNSHTPVPDLHPTKYYGEASVRATITTSQSLTFAYRQWNWVSSTGFVPEFDSSYDLAYHWNATRQLGFDLDAKIQEADYTSGNDTAGSVPCDRVDRMYSLSPGVSYAFTPQLSASLNYTYDAGNNELANSNFPAAAQATAGQTAYRNFIHQVISLGLLYKF
jgi:opacity protein-like surface antigen